MRRILLTALFLATPVMAGAATVSPISYGYVNVPNGGTAYLDDTYNGTTGELADGVKATVNWPGTDGFGAPGPNVGWNSVNPVIQFFFDQVYDFTQLTMNIQDGQGAAGVGLAESITVNGVTSPTLVGGSIATPIDVVMNLGPLAATDSLLVTVTRGSQWTFLSEFTFEANVSTVPLPASFAMLLVGLAGLGGWRGRQRLRFGNTTAMRKPYAFHTGSIRLNR